ncbi:MAG TPA: DegT/DnrJ/EryC1/StrS family aminotransferase, partial [bacterium]|nr:DegT/DnrJ/EryC1/StrS family aminotransferase [bacterium]
MIPRIKPIFNNEILQVLNSVNSDEINSAAENFKSELKKNYGFNEIIFFESGRSALSCCLKQIKTEKKFEVIISAFTCSVVADAVINSGCRPVFADCDLSDFSLDVDSMINCVSDKTLAIIYPHHFGIASKGVLKAADYVKEKKIFLIEDIAQSLFCSVNAKYAGSFGDLAVMSFGL